MLALALVALLSSFLVVDGHGRLRDPPSRSSMWRDGFKTPPNYIDHQLFCGGFVRQYRRNQGQCGICGDPWDATQPRRNEAGGRYGLGIITRKYKVGQAIDIKVEITTHHKGWFEFRLCPNNNPKQIATHECLNRYILELADGSGSRYVLPAGSGNGWYNLKFKLPPGLSCTQCVIQWKYNTGNRWGRDPETGKSCLGCGNQEQFYGCADVSISA